MTKFDTSREVRLVTCLASSNGKDEIVHRYVSINLTFFFFLVFSPKFKKKKKNHLHNFFFFFFFFFLFLFIYFFLSNKHALIIKS